MFCPKCATQNVDGASYCRACGANISLVPQALSGTLPAAEPAPRPVGYSRRRHRRDREPSIEDAIRSLTMGIAFVVVSIMVGKFAPGGSVWWFWMLIPAFGLFAKGFSELARLKLGKPQDSAGQPQLNTMRPQDLPAPRTGELRTPVPSVTEGTTRHLGVEAKTQQFNYPDSQKPS